MNTIYTILYQVPTTGEWRVIGYAVGLNRAERMSVAVEMNYGYYTKIEEGRVA